MIKDINHIILSGEEFPIRLDNLILQKVQERYGTLTEFELRLMGWGKSDDGNITMVSEPSMEVLNWILPELIHEGLAVEGKDDAYTNEDIIRLVDMRPLSLALLIHNEIDRAFERKKKEPIAESKQQRNLTEKPQKLTLFGCIYLAIQSYISQKNK